MTIRYVSAWTRDMARLRANGYTEVEGAPQEPGHFRVVSYDVAVGYSDYQYELDVYEHPDHPLAELGWRDP
jgi:hypothetical protein